MSTADKIQNAIADTLTAQEAAERLSRTPRLIQNLCKRGAFPGAFQIGRDWRIPKSAVAARKRRQAGGKLPKGGRGISPYAA